MNARPDPFDEIAARLESLEHRVLELEHTRRDSAQVSRDSVPAAAAVTSWPQPLPQFNNVLPILGSALLGIAGAYLLRAVSGAGLLPRMVVALMAALYAAAWLFAAERSSRRRNFAVASYAAVSLLILVPMLWEMTVRFGAMRGSAAAVILALYVALAAISSLRRGAVLVFAMTIAGSAIAAVALSIATHRMVEFTFLLVALSILCEVVQRTRDFPGMRTLVAVMADLAVWTMLLIYRLPPPDRADYPAVSNPLLFSAPVLLFALELVALGRQVLLRGEPMTVLAAVQAMVSFGLVAAALVRLTPGSAELAIGIVCLVLAAACFATAFGPVRREAHRRNFRVLNVWATGLLIGALFLLSSGQVASVALGILAVAAVLLAGRVSSRTLELQGALFLAVAAGSSGLAIWTVRELASALQFMPSEATLAVTVCAVLAYTAADEKAGDDWRGQIVHLIPALLAAFAVAAFLVLALLHLAGRFLAPDVFHIALIQTFALSLLALALAWAGTRLNRPAMVRTAYTAVAFVIAKLVFEDLWHGHLGFTAASIFVVAMTLIAVPRFTRNRRVSE